MSKIGALTLVGFIAINVAGTVYHLFLEGKLRKTRQPPVVEIGSTFPAFNGVDVRGVKWESRDTTCRVIRITDDHCSYCKKDKPSYASLLDAARRASCEVIELSPTAGKMAYDPRPGVTQLKFVDVDFGQLMFPLVTPQTVILDRDWSLKWTRRGIFDDASLAGSIALLESLGADNPNGANALKTSTQ